MRILLTGGGTAGHVNPALAIAAAVKERQADAEFLFVASALPNDKANDLVPRAGYELQTVHIRGMRAPLYHPSNLMLPFVMARSKREAKRIIQDFDPDLIVGTGGFACWPIMAVGAAMRIPTVLHESNAQPGKAIRQLRNRVDKILVNFPETVQAFGIPDAEVSGRVVRVGNPHMPGFATVSREDARRQLGIPADETFILAFGGSLGAEYVNDAVVSLAGVIAREHPHTALLHATGKRDFTRMSGAYAASGVAGCPRIRFTDYIYDMPLRMAAADLVISRAGAMSISELALTGKAAILIPSPRVADNHQYKNAMALERAGAGVCVEEETADKRRPLENGALTDAVLSLFADPERMRRMGKTIRERFACPDANEVIYRELMKVCRT